MKKSQVEIHDAKFLQTWSYKKPFTKMFVQMGFTKHLFIGLYKSYTFISCNNSYTSSLITVTLLLF